MQRNSSLTLFALVIVAAAIAPLSGCANAGGKEAGKTDTGKIPVTTSSEEAKKEFLAAPRLLDI